MVNHIQITDYKTKRYNLPAKVMLIIFLVILGMAILHDNFLTFKINETAWMIITIILILSIISTIFLQYQYLLTSKIGFIKIKDNSIEITENSFFEIQAKTVNKIYLYLYGYYPPAPRIMRLFYNFSYMNKISIETFEKKTLEYKIIISDKNDIEYLYKKLFKWEDKVIIIYMRYNGILNEYHTKLNKKYKNTLPNN